jgi:hypothetical protein
VNILLSSITISQGDFLCKAETETGFGGDPRAFILEISVRRGVHEYSSLHLPTAGGWGNDPAVVKGMEANYAQTIPDMGKTAFLRLFAGQRRFKI